MSPTGPCNGYWYDVNVKTPSAGHAYRCINQDEYNAIMAQQSHDDQVAGMQVAVVFGTILVATVLALATYWIIKLIRKNK